MSLSTQVGKLLDWLLEHESHNMFRRRELKVWGADAQVWQGFISRKGSEPSGARMSVQQASLQVLCTAKWKASAC